MGPEENESPEERPDEDREVRDRILLPLLVPAAVFLFALLVIYGLSRIYLELNDFAVGDVTMATPLAIGVAIAILAVAWYLASRPAVPRWQLASIGAVAVALLTGGAIWAAVHDEGEAAEVVGPAETPIADGTPATPGGIEVSLVEFAVAPGQDTVEAGTITFRVSNDGGQVHNFRVISTDLAPDALPLDEDGFVVDEDQVDVVGSLDPFLAGETQELSVELAAGSYVLICNIPTHYDLGMSVAFTVE